MTILVGEAWQVHSALWKEHGDRLSPDVAERLEAASTLSGAELDWAWETARRWSEELSEVLRTVEVIALPTLTDHPPTLAQGAQVAVSRCTAPFNLSGNPAISLPLRTDGPAAVPASVQLVAGHMQEELILATSALVEDLAGFRSERRGA